MKRTMLTMLLLVLSVASARIGLEAEAVEAELAADESVVAAATFGYEAITYDGLLFALQGSSDGSPESLAAIGAAVGYATGFGEQIQGPVESFLTVNLADLLVAERAVVPVEGSYLLELELAEDEAGLVTIDWSIALAEIDTGMFLPVNYALGADAADARLVIREFGDLQCPHCRNFALEVLPEIRELLAEDDGLRFEFHHMPLVTIHANAIPAAEALECVAAVNGEDSFWTFSDTIFERMQAWAALPETAGYFISLASEVGLETEGVAECLEEREYLDYIRASYDSAVNVLGVTGTPTTFIDGIRVTRWNQAAGYEELIRLLDARSSQP